MERQANRGAMKTGISFLVILLFLMAQPLSACFQGTGSYREELYAHYIREDMEQWKGVIDRMEREYARHREQGLLYDLCFTYYGYIGYLIQQERDREAKEMLVRALERSKTLEEILDGRGDILALRGGLLGYKLVLSKFTAPLVGPKALKYIRRSQDSRHLYFNCSVEMGNMLFFTPGYLGGQKKKAISYYEDAVNLLEKSPLKPERHWIYMNTVLLLANAYKETGQQDKACRLYRGLMEYEPEATWIREDLYPGCGSN